MAKTIYEMKESKQAREEAKEFVYQLFKTDYALYKRAVDLVCVLGVGGLWQGVDLAIMHTAKALEQEQIILRDKIDSIPEIVIKGESR